MWIALDCSIGEHPKVAGLPNDSARYGWILTLLAAKRQRQPGRFASERHYREVLPKYAKHLPHFLEAKLIEQATDGSLQVHDWKQYQWASQKQRQREDNPKTIEGQNEDKNETSRAGNAVPVPPKGDVSVERNAGEGVQGERVLPRFPVKGMNGEVSEVDLRSDLPPDADKLQHLAEELTGRPYVMANLYSGQNQKAIEEQLRPHRWNRVEQAWRQVNARIRASQDGPPTLRQLILGADDLLNPIPTGLSREAHEREEQARFDRRVANTRARYADRP